MRSLVVERTSWPLHGVFAISRGTRTLANVVDGRRLHPATRERWG